MESKTECTGMDTFIFRNLKEICEILAFREDKLNIKVLINIFIYEKYNYACVEREAIYVLIWNNC